MGLATDAWRVGLSAIMNAYRQAEESRLTDIGKTLKEDLDKQLAHYVEKQQTSLVQVLAKYFDPRDGQIVTRLEGFLRDEGDLARTMNRFLAPEHGVLAKTLARELGETSPLLRRLSPTDSEGVLFMVEARLRDALVQNQAEVARALDPLAENGAVARFLRALREELQTADDDRARRLELATKALDPGNDNSLLNRLVRETANARTELVSAMNPDIPNSPLAILKSALTVQLQQNGEAQRIALEAMGMRQAKLEQDIREALVRMEERKRGMAKSTHGGMEFQECVFRFVQSMLQGGPMIVDVTANLVGAKKGCKVGDQVVTFTEESAYQGSKLVIEAKRESGVTVTDARRELEMARGNRLANCGIFVMARSHASATFPPFARIGNDILVVWDESDEATNPYLQAAIMLGLALAGRQKRSQDTGDIQALADIEHCIQKEVERLEKMRKMCEAIRTNADNLADEVRKGNDALGRLLGKAKSTLKALNVELVEANGAAPVMFSADVLRPAQVHAGENQVLPVRRSA